MVRQPWYGMKSDINAFNRIIQHIDVMKTHYITTFLLCIATFAGCVRSEKEYKITEHVNPLIGTSGYGYCFPGASLPFGGIQLSPDTYHKEKNEYTAYHYDDTLMASFSHTHLSGSNIRDLQDIRILPVNKKPAIRENTLPFIRSCYAAYTHEQETIEPGYYGIKLKNGITTEASVTERCGIYYFQYPADSIHGMTLDLSSSAADDSTQISCIKKINNRTIEGYRKSRGVAKDQRVYFVMEFSQDINILAGQEYFAPLENGQKITGSSCYGWIDFGNNTDKILAKISISSANCNGAATNLEKELSHWSFDKVKRDAKNAWRRELEKIRVEGKEEYMTRFYTALYHTFLAPQAYSDLNGNFKGPDQEINSTGNKHIQYSAMFPKATYAALYPLFSITQKKITGDVVHSMLEHYDAYGLLPAGELFGNEIYDIRNNKAISIISEAILKGIRGFDKEYAYQAMRKTLLHDRFLIEPYDIYCMQEVAKALQKADDVLFFSRLAEEFPAAPEALSHNSGNFTITPQKQEALKQKLDAIFTDGHQPTAHRPFCCEGDCKKIGQYDHNDPNMHHLPYLYTYTEQSHKTAHYIEKIRSELYENTANGLCAADSFGQLSAWYVFSAIGIYPVNPPDMKYVIGTPLFKRVIIKLNAENRFIITANKESDAHIYVKQVFLNGEELKRNWITHQEILQGGELRFVLTDREPLE